MSLSIGPQRSSDPLAVRHANRILLARWERRGRELTPKLTP